MSASEVQMVAVTGASGFVGRAVVAALAADPRFACRACYRRAPGALPAGVSSHVTGDIEGADWSAALQGAHAVVHTAARAHVMREGAADPLAEYRRINVDGTLSLARAAAAAGVRRFVFISSIGVNGEATSADRPFTEDDPARPMRPYSRSKLEAEEGLARIAAETGMELVVLRPPLVVGPGAGGNIARLRRLIERGLPLPFGAVRNRRSFVSIDNLCSAIITCLVSSAAAGRTYLVSDQADLSTPELIARLAAEDGRRARLWPVPVPLLMALAGLAGRGEEMARLTGSLCVDSSRLSRETGWHPYRATGSGSAPSAGEGAASRR